MALPDIGDLLQEAVDAVLAEVDATSGTTNSEAHTGNEPNRASVSFNDGSKNRNVKIHVEYDTQMSSGTHSTI